MTLTLTLTLNKQTGRSSLICDTTQSSVPITIHCFYRHIFKLLFVTNFQFHFHFFFFLDFSVILIFLLASEEGLFSDRNIGQFVKVYIFFGLFFCLLLRSAVRISLPFHISLTLNLTLKQHSFFKKLKVDHEPTLRFTDTPF